MRRLLPLLFVLPAPAWATTVVLEVGNVRSTEGQMLVAIFRGEPGFPSEPDRAVHKQIAVPVAPTTTVSVELPPGEYAVSVVHDQNKNGTLDLGRIIPMPAEPLGSSRDAKGSFGPPKYADAKFVVPAEGRHVERFKLVNF